jgi:glutamate/aspartate transport system substrate-binding protein
MMRNAFRLLLVFTAALTFCATASAENLTGTLKKIKDTGVVALGYREASIPFSYLDANNKPVGYSMDLCYKIVDGLKKKLDMPNLKVKLVPVTSSTRMPLIANGTIDMSCGSATNTIERQKQVDFLDTTFVTGTKLLVRSDSGIKSYKDLKGKTLVVTTGTTNERVLKALNDKEHLDMRFINAKDHPESALAVETGRASAFPMDDILLYGIKATAKDPKVFSIVGDFLSYEPYAIIVRKNDPQFKKFADGVLVGLFKSGEINTIYKKWFESPIPPKNVNLNLPMSPQLQKVIAHPTSKGRK